MNFFKRATIAWRAAKKAFRSYDLGKTYGRNQEWIGVQGSAKAEIFPALAPMIKRSRDLCANNYLAIRGKRKYGSSLVGTGIVANSSGQEGNIVDDLWEDWAPFADFDENEILQGLFRLSTYTIFESGSCFVLRRRNNRNHDIQLAVQILEPDYLDLNKFKLRSSDRQGLPAGSYIENGIQYDDLGRVEGYWLFKTHPGDLFTVNSYQNAFESFFVPRSDCRLVFWQERSGTQIGAPFLAQSGTTLNDIAECDLAEIVRKKMAGCYTAFVRDIDTPGDEDKDSDLEKLTPGRIEKLPAGKTIEFANPPANEETGYIKSRKKDVAAGINLAYEALTSDFAEVNFSSSRMSRQEQEEFMDQLQTQLVIPKICELIRGWFVEELFLSGRINTNKIKTEWTPPRREFIQPVDDVEGLRKQMAIGALTPSQMVRKTGKNPEKHWQEYARDIKNIEGLGIKLEILEGQAQAQPQPEGDQDNG